MVIDVRTLVKPLRPIGWMVLAPVDAASCGYPGHGSGAVRILQLLDVLEIEGACFRTNIPKEAGCGNIRHEMTSVAGMHRV